MILNQKSNNNNDESEAFKKIIKQTSHGLFNEQGNKYIRDTFMTTKDAMEEITKYDTLTCKLSYLELLVSSNDIQQQQNVVDLLISLIRILCQY